MLHIKTMGPQSKANFVFEYRTETELWGVYVPEIDFLRTVADETHMKMYHTCFLLPGTFAETDEEFFEATHPYIYDQLALGHMRKGKDNFVFCLPPGSVKTQADMMDCVGWFVRDRNTRSIQTSTSVKDLTRYALFMAALGFAKHVEQTICHMMKYIHEHMTVSNLEHVLEFARAQSHTRLLRRLAAVVLMNEPHYVSASVRDTLVSLTETLFPPPVLHTVELP
jgi:hypothetical protein